MQIKYKSKKLERICNDFGDAKKRYSEEMAGKIQQRIQELSAADSIIILLQFSIGGCHSLKGNRKGQYAMDLVQPFRLLFEKVDEQTIRIISIQDYH